MSKEPENQTSGFIASIKVFDTTGIVYLCVSTLVSTLLSLVLPFSILIIFDRVVPNQAMSTLMILFAIILVSVWLDNFVKQAEGRFTSKITEAFERKVNDRVYESLINADMAKYEMLDPSDVINRVGTVAMVKNHNSTDVITAIVNAITCTIVWATIAIINGGAGAIILAASIYLFIQARALGVKKLAQLASKEEKESQSNAKIVEIISKPISVKSGAMEYRLENVMGDIVEERESYNSIFEQLEATYSLYLQTISQLSVALVVGFCASSVIGGAIGQGAMAAVIMLTNRYFSPYQQVMTSLARRKTNEWHIDRLTELINLAPDQKTTPDQQIEHVEIETKNLTHTFSRGEVVCVTGDACTGKSLLLKTLSREYVSDIAVCRANGVKMSDIDYGWWRDNVVRVHEQSQFIDGSIIDNITSFRPSLNKTAFALCQSMGVRHYIDGLRLGFYTQIKSSSPLPFPRQVRYALLVVRAMLTQKQIYLFDDIDTVSDSIFLERFANTLGRIRDRTIVLIVSKDMDTDHYGFKSITASKVKL